MDIYTAPILIRNKLWALYSDKKQLYTLKTHNTQLETQQHTIGKLLQKSKIQYSYSKPYSDKNI